MPSRGSITQRTPDVPAAVLVYLVLLAGLVHFVASDSHGTRRRPPGLKRAYYTVAGRWGEKVARRLVADPARVRDPNRKGTVENAIAYELDDLVTRLTAAVTRARASSRQMSGSGTRSANGLARLGIVRRRDGQFGRILQPDGNGAVTEVRDLPFADAVDVARVVDDAHPQTLLRGPPGDVPKQLGGVL